MKNIEINKIINLADEIVYNDGQISSKTLIQNDKVSMTLFSFAKDEEIGSHSSAGNAMVTILDGKGKFTVGDDIHILTKGETLIMPANIPHAVYSEEKFKMLLTVLF